ncbi:MAG: glycosyltransferase family 2 protein [Alcanivorax sp.]
MSDFPLITVGICCYNSEDTVARAIKSALAQDWPNLEVIIIDDGSQDNTAEIIQETIEADARAVFIQHETNKTFPGALNTVINNAKGEFIAIFDDDDESVPNRLSVQYKTIIDYENKTGAALVACWGSGVRRYPNGYDVKLEAIGSKNRGPIGTEIIDFLLYFGRKKGVFYGSGTPSCSLMTRKSTYGEVGLYDETMFRSEDADFSIRLGLNGGHFIGCGEDVLIQYATGGAEKRASVVYESYKTVMLKYKDYLVSQKRFGYAMLWNKLRLHHFGGEKAKAVLILAQLFLRYPFLTWNHFWVSAPRRLVHEWKMKRRPS